MHTKSDNGFLKSKKFIKVLSDSLIFTNRKDLFVDWWLSKM